VLVLEENKILPVLISYTVPYADMLADTDGWDWIKIALRSFHAHFPGEKVLVVDNDSDDNRYARKRAWLHAYSGAVVIRNPLTREAVFWRHHHPRHNHHHGAGIDLAVDYCRQRGYEFLLYFEPDCLVAGRAWVENMWRQLQGGAWMTGGNIAARTARIIHVCPSMWRIDSPCCATSFMRQSKERDRQHPLFTVLTGFDEVALTWEKWDTAQKNWWIAALHGKAWHSTIPSGDFFHYWSGSGYLGKNGVRGHPHHARFAPYLDESRPAHSCVAVASRDDMK
jgi:hypothetical protein